MQMFSTPYHCLKNMCLQSLGKQEKRTEPQSKGRGKETHSDHLGPVYRSTGIDQLQSHLFSDRPQQLDMGDTIGKKFDIV